MGDVIREGHLRAGFIRAVDRLHGPLLFRFAPMLAETVERTEAEFDRAIAQAKGQGSLLIAAQLARHVRTWDAQEEDGKPAPIDLESCRRLHPAVQRRLYRIVAGLEASDDHPAVAADAARGSRSYLDELLDEARGDAPGQATSRALEGNSEGA